MMRHGGYRPGGAVLRRLSDEEAPAYQALYPSREYQTGALLFPRLVPTRRDHAGAYQNHVAVRVLRNLDIPVLMPWGGKDPIIGPLSALVRRSFRNAAEPFVIEDAGRFIEEDAGEQVAEYIRDWLMARLDA